MLIVPPHHPQPIRASGRFVRTWANCKPFRYQFLFVVYMSERSGMLLRLYKVVARVDVALSVVTTRKDS